LSPSSSLLLLAKTITHAVARSLCDSWASCLYSAYNSKESLGASVAKEMCFQRSSERIEGKCRPPQSGWKIVPQSRTGCRETPVAKFVVCSWHEQLPDVVGMRPQRTTTSVRQKMTVMERVIRGLCCTGSSKACLKCKCTAREGPDVDAKKLLELLRRVSKRQ